MKRPLFVAVVLLLIICSLMALDDTLKAKADGTAANVTATSTVQVVKDILTKRQRAWIYSLGWCESRYTDSAINKVDLDGTPSFGRFQFKPSTFTYYLRRYNLGSSTDFMDGNAQEKIVEQMIVRADVKWSQQFPNCTRMLGLPPLSPTLSTTSIDKN